MTEAEHFMIEAAVQYGFTPGDEDMTVYLATPEEIVALMRAVREQGQKDMSTFQERVGQWADACFGPDWRKDRPERQHRFLEEALELVQALGTTRAEAHQLVDYAYGRPAGHPPQEVGGVRTTLAALCIAHSLDERISGETELARISDPAVLQKIRAKQAAKPKVGPLPGPTDEQRHNAYQDWALGGGSNGG